MLLLLRLSCAQDTATQLPLLTASSPSPVTLGASLPSEEEHVPEGN